MDLAKIYGITSDDSVFGSLFPYRGFIADTTCEWLNSSRVCLRR